MHNYYSVYLELFSKRKKTKKSKEDREKREKQKAEQLEAARNRAFHDALFKQGGLILLIYFFVHFFKKNNIFHRICRKC